MPKTPKKTPKKASPLLDENEGAVGEKTFVAKPKKDGSTLQDPSIPLKETKKSFPADDDFNTKAPAEGKSSEKGNVGKEMQSDKEITRQNLAKEEQVHFMIPLGIGEKVGAFEEVWINGFHTQVPKGKMAIIPKSIADLLANKYQVEATAGEEFRLDLHPEKDVSSI